MLCTYPKFFLFAKVKFNFVSTTHEEISIVFIFIPYILHRHLIFIFMYEHLCMDVNVCAYVCVCINGHVLCV